MANKTILVDGNSIGYAGHHATKLRVGDLETQAVLSFCRSMRGELWSNPHAGLMVLWDGRAQWRYDLHPDYKSNRDDSPEKRREREAYKAQRPYIARALHALGITQMTAYDREADDLAGLMVNRLTARGDEVELSTGDEDWLQLLRKGVTWRDPRNDEKRITLANFLDKTGYASPLAFLEGKALQGDGSDVISGVGGIGETGAPLFLAEHGSVRRFWQRCEAGEIKPANKAQQRLLSGRCPMDRDEWMATFTYDRDPTHDDEKHRKAEARAVKKHGEAWPGQGRALFNRNFMLMQLLKPRPLDPSQLFVDRGEFNRQAFTELCEELSFNSILKTMDAFIAPFARRFQN